MNSSASDGRWSRRRWLLLIGLIFSGQVALIFLLGEHSPARARTRGPAPAFRLASPRAAEFLALEDPTLFALPHRQGFSGRAWLHVFSQKLPSFEWSEQPQWLPLPVAQLGQTFNRFMETNQPGLGPVLAIAESELMVPEISPGSVLREESALRLSGSLAARRLLTPLALKSWPNADVLTNTVVHVLVDGSGQTFSPKVLLPGSGSKEADQYALEQAKAARFDSILPTGPQSVTNPPARLTSGEMIFEWHTLPLPGTKPPLPVVQP